MNSILARIVLGIYRSIPHAIRIPLLLIGFVLFNVFLFRNVKEPAKVWAAWKEILAVELIIALPLGYLIYTGADE